MTIKEIAEKMYQEASDSVIKDEILEKYYTQQVLKAKSGKGTWENMLGVVQRSIGEKKDVIQFLAKYITEL